VLDVSRALVADAAPDGPGATPGLQPPPAAAAAPGDSLVSVLDAALAQDGSRAAMRMFGRTLRHAELDRLARAFAAFLHARGLARGERVLLLLDAGLPLPVVVLGALRAGLVLVPADPDAEATAVARLLEDTGARAVVAAERGLAALQQALELRQDASAASRASSMTPAAPDTGPLVVAVSAGDLLGPLKAALARRPVRHRVLPHGLKGVVALATALDRGRHLAALPAAPQADDIAALVYTGGTTGTARGVVLLHRHLVANLRQAAAWLADADRHGREPWTVLAALPLHHVFGFTLVLLLGLERGWTLLPVPDLTDTDALIATLQRERVHHLPSVQPVFEALARHPLVERADWRALKLALAGGLAVEPATAMLWMLKTGRPLIQGYGLAECSPAVCCNRVDEAGFSGHVGWPLEGTEIILVDDEGQPVPRGQRGEIAVRGPQVMAGYWQRPDETARALLPSGHLRTGDIGEFVEGGALRLVDRRPDLIWVQGLPVMPSEVEEVVLALPGVVDCAAVAQPDAEQGQCVRLVVVRREATTPRPDEAAVRAHCERHLAGYQRPRIIEFSDALPRGPMGKLLRRRLRDSGVAAGEQAAQPGAAANGAGESLPPGAQ
jgi:long-chain acyl-CoA synthetase